MGKEGLDAGLYKVRPSHEVFRCAMFGFKNGFKAVRQEAEEDSGVVEPM